MRNAGTPTRAIAVRAGATTTPQRPTATAAEAPDDRRASCALPADVPAQQGNLNVLGTPLITCSEAPLTGFRRTGR